MNIKDNGTRLPAYLSYVGLLWSEADRCLNCNYKIGMGDIAMGEAIILPKFMFQYLPDVKNKKNVISLCHTCLGVIFNRFVQGIPLDDLPMYMHYDKIEYIGSYEGSLEDKDIKVCIANKGEKGSSPMANNLVKAAAINRMSGTPLILNFDEIENSMYGNA